MLKRHLPKDLIKILPYVLFCVFFSFLPGFSGKYILSLVTMVFIWSIGAVAYDLLMGYAGLVSFGFAATWGVGCYTVGILVSKGITENFFIIFIVALLLGFIISAFIGFLALRTSGIYFTLSTLAIAQLLYVLTIKWRNFTGGENGLSGIPKPLSLGEVEYYYLVLISLVACFFLMRRIVNSWFGRAIMGIRDNESRMLMLGYNTWAYKYIIFIIAGVFCTIGGVFSCYHIGIASPDNFSLYVTGNFLLMVLIGGRATLFGPVIGSFIIVFLTHFLSAFIVFWLTVLGTIFILVVMFMRKGIGGFIQEWLQKIEIVN